jgi:hypothetical protein
MLDDLVTLASSFLEACAVKDNNLAARAGDWTQRTLQRCPTPLLAKN